MTTAPIEPSMTAIGCRASSSIFPTDPEYEELEHVFRQYLHPRRKVRKVLNLGEESDLTLRQRFVVKSAAWAADTFPDKASAAAQASERLGLPRDFRWKSKAKQKQLLAELNQSASLQGDVA